MSNDGKLAPVTLIGAGIMGEALLSGLIASGVAPVAITIVEKREERAQELCDRYGVIRGELSEAVAKSGTILLVVKPQDLGSLLAEIKGSLNAGTLLVSFVAGKKIAFITSHFDIPPAVIRVMPNTPTLVGEGMAAISLGAHVSTEQAKFVSTFLAATGKVVEVVEELQDAVTAVSGSGPAYFFYFAESMIKTGMELGLSMEIATKLTVQTMVGAAKLLATSGKSATTLRENVTSPKGTTAAAIASFDSQDLSAIIKKAMVAARDRSIELA